MRNRLPDTTKIEGIRLMEERDVEAVTVLSGAFLGKFDLAPVYSEEHIRHWLLHEGDEETRVIWTYVVEVQHQRCDGISDEKEFIQEDY